MRCVAHRGFGDRGDHDGVRLRQRELLLKEGAADGFTDRPVQRAQLPVAEQAFDALE